MPENNKPNPFRTYTEDSLQKGQQSRRSVGQMRASPSWQSGAPPTALERMGRGLGDAFNDGAESMMSRNPIRQLERQRYLKEAQAVMIEEQRQRSAYITQMYKERLAQQPAPAPPAMPMPENSHNWTPEEHAFWRQAMAAQVKREQDYQKGQGH